MSNEKTCTHPLLSFLTEEERNALGSCLTRKEIKEGQVIWTEGDEATFAALVIEGKIELLKDTTFGGRRFVVGLYSEGSIVGEEALSRGTELRPETAIAVEDCTLMEMEPCSIEELAETHPKTATTVLTSLLAVSTKRLSQAYLRMASIF